MVPIAEVNAAFEAGVPIVALYCRGKGPVFVHVRVWHLKLATCSWALRLLASSYFLFSSANDTLAA